MSFIPFSAPSPRVRRPALDRDQVVAAGLALLTDVGLDGLTMRLLAARLGVRAPSLYRHVKDKAELLILLADAVSALAEDVDEAQPWRERVLAHVMSYRKALRAVRDGARLLAETPPLGPNRLRKIDALLGALLASGCTAKEAAETSYHLNNLVVGFAADEVRAADWMRESGVDPKDLAERKRAFTRLLSTEEFPNLAALAEFAGVDDQDDVFLFGVNLLLDGLAFRIARAPPMA